MYEIISMRAVVHTMRRERRYRETTETYVRPGRKPSTPETHRSY